MLIKNLLKSKTKKKTKRTYIQILRGQSNQTMTTYSQVSFGTCSHHTHKHNPVYWKILFCVCSFSISLYFPIYTEWNCFSFRFPCVFVLLLFYFKNEIISKKTQYSGIWCFKFIFCSVFIPFQLLWFECHCCSSYI